MSSNVPRQPLPFTRGVNIQMDPTNIGDDEAVELRNLWPTQPGGPIDTRPALGVVREPWWYTPSTNQRELLVQWHDWVNGMLTTYMVQQRSTTPVEVLFVAAGQADPALASFNQLAVTPAASPPWSVRVNNKVYYMNGAGLYVIDGDTLIPGLGNGAPVPEIRASTAGITPKFAANVRERMWYVGLGDGRQNRVAVSDRFLPEQVPDEAYWFDVGSEDEGPITAIAEAAATDGGSLETNLVLIFKRNAVYVCRGEPAQGTDTPGTTTDWRLGTLIVSKMQVQAGCVSQRSIASSPRGLYWLGSDDVWFMPFASAPIPVGTKIRPALARVDESREQWMYATFVGGVLRVSCDSDGQATTDSYGSPAAPAEEYWLDCRNPAGGDTTDYPSDAAAARWFGPQRYISGGEAGDVLGMLYARTIKQSDGAPAHEGVYGGEFASDALGTFYFVSGLFVIQVGAATHYDSVRPVLNSVNWESNTAYEEGDVVTPGAFLLNGYDDRAMSAVDSMFLLRSWRCSVAGTSGFLADVASQGMSGAGATFVDGTVTWVPEWNALGTRRINRFHYALKYPIEPVIVTKEYDFGEPIIEKLVQGVEMSHASPWVVPLLVTSIIDEQTTEFTTRLGQVARMDTIVVPSSGEVALKGQRRFVTDYLPLDGGGTKRLVGTTAQLRIERDITKEVYIDALNDSFEYAILSEAYSVVLPHGWLSMFADIIPALTADTEANSGGLVTVELTSTGLIALVARGNFAAVGVGKYSGGLTPPSSAGAKGLHALLGFNPNLGIECTPVPSPGTYGYPADTQVAVADAGVLAYSPTRLYVRDMRMRVRPFTRRFKR